MAMDSKKIDWLRVLLCTVAVCVVAVALFGFYDGNGAEIIAKYSADDKSPNLVWFFEHVFAAVPVLAMVIVSGFFYMGKEKCDPLSMHIEKTVIFGAAAFFIYALMLPIVIASSPETVDPETNEAIQTLWDRTHIWFFSQILPLLIVIAYHVVRVQSLKSAEDPDGDADGEADDETDADDEEDNDE